MTALLDGLRGCRTLTEATQYLLDHPETWMDFGLTLKSRWFAPGDEQVFVYGRWFPC